MDDPREYKNILVIHFGQLGDVVLALSALDAIRSRFAGSRVTLLVGKSTVEIARLADVADEYIAVDRVQMRDGNKLRSISAIFSLATDIRRRRFDLVIDLHSLSETNLFGFVAGIPKRLYANRENRSIDRLSNFRPRPPAEDKTRHLTDRYFDAIQPLGIEQLAERLVLSPQDAYIATVKAKFPILEPGERRIVGLFPGAGHPSRCWPLDRFGELANVLHAENIGVAIFLGPEESTMKNEVVRLMPNADVLDGLNLAQFIAAVSQVSVFVANDTGPAHLAASSGVPLVLILDARAPTTYLPLSDHLTVVGGKLIDEIEVDQVLTAIQHSLARSFRA